MKNSRPFHTPYTHRAFLQYDFLVVLEGNAKPEGFTTLFPFIGFLFSVHPFMYFKQTGRNECSLTRPTFKRSFSKVSDHVYLKAGVSTKGFPTFLTFVEFSLDMSPFRSPQKRETTESFTIFFIPVDFLSYVSSFTCFKNFMVSIRFSMLFMMMAFLSSVGSFIRL